MAGDKTHSVVRPSGTLIIYDPALGRYIQMDTVQCCHCGGHWTVQPGSGKIRGYCARCDGFFCGPGCLECVPEEQFLENLEKGRPANFRPVSASVPGIVLGG